MGLFTTFFFFFQKKDDPDIFKKRANSSALNSQTDGRARNNLSHIVFLANSFCKKIFLKCKSINLGCACTRLGAAGGAHAVRHEDKPARSSAA